MKHETKKLRLCDKDKNSYLQFIITITLMSYELFRSLLDDFRSVYRSNRHVAPNLKATKTYKTEIISHTANTIFVVTKS